MTAGLRWWTTPSSRRFHTVILAASADDVLLLSSRSLYERWVATSTVDPATAGPTTSSSVWPLEVPAAYTERALAITATSRAWIAATSPRRSPAECGGEGHGGADHGAARHLRATRGRLGAAALLDAAVHRVVVARLLGDLSAGVGSGEAVVVDAAGDGGEDHAGRGGEDVAVE